MDPTNRRKARLAAVVIIASCFFITEGSAQGCRDRTVQCRKFVHYCNNLQQQKLMKDYCPLTCGYCGCVDKAYCRSFKRVSCLGEFYGFALKRDCPVLCNSCSSRSNRIANHEMTQLASCVINNGGCDQRCHEVNRRVYCSCYPGFDLGDDKKTCQDINECSQEANYCAMQRKPQACINTRGSFFCTSSMCSDVPGLYNKYNSNECCYKETSLACGRDTASVRNDNPRITGGFAAHFTAWPWQVQIWINDDKLCGGSLINELWVVSAAHCFNNVTENSKISLVFGRLKANSTEDEESHVQWRRSVEITFHPEYHADFFAMHDIVLLRVDRPVIFDAFVNPICLPNGEKPPPGTKCWASGFGTTESGGSLAKELREVDLKIVSKSDCVAEFPMMKDLVDQGTSFCAGSKGVKDTCQGDSGGPIMCQRCASCSWYLTGITSAGRSCGRTYGLYTDVLRYEEWIGTVTSTPVNSEKTCRKQHQSQWTGWGEWSECSASCGGGSKLRHRSCWNGAVGSANCRGVSFENLGCNELPCTEFNKKNALDAYTVVHVAKAVPLRRKLVPIAVNTQNSLSPLPSSVAESVEQKLFG